MVNLLRNIISVELARWTSLLQKKTSTMFVKRGEMKGIEKLRLWTYRCSGLHVNAGSSNESPSSTANNCPATLLVEERNNGLLYVSYYPTHFGHDISDDSTVDKGID